LPLAKDHPVYKQGAAGLKNAQVWSDSKTKQAGIFELRNT
jgi:hypothetical protein